jgi:hypothetical protein
MPYILRPHAQRTENTRIHLVDQAELQDCVDYSKRPKGVKVCGLGPMMLNKIEHDRAEYIRRNEGREYRECSEPAADQQDKKQEEMCSEAGRPEQKVELSQLNLYPSVRAACQDHYAAEATSRTVRQGSIPASSVQ